MIDIPPVLWFSIKEVASMLRCSERTVRSYLNKGVVPARVVNGGKHHLTVMKCIDSDGLATLFEAHCPILKDLDAKDRRAKAIAWRARVAIASANGRRKARRAREARKAAEADPSPKTEDPED